MEDWNIVLRLWRRFVMNDSWYRKYRLYQALFLSYRNLATQIHFIQWVQPDYVTPNILCNSSNRYWILKFLLLKHYIYPDYHVLLHKTRVILIKQPLLYEDILLYNIKWRAGFCKRLKKDDLVVSNDFIQDIQNHTE